MREALTRWVQNAFDFHMLVPTDLQHYCVLTSPQKPQRTVSQFTTVNIRDGVDDGTNVPPYDCKPLHPGAW